MIKVLRLFLVFVILCHLTMMAGPAFAADPMEDLLTNQMPNITTSIPKEYNQYPIWEYTVDTDIGMMDWQAKSMSVFFNAIFLVISFCVRLAIMLLEQAFTLDVLSGVASKVGEFVTGVKQAVWDPFINIVLVLTALYVLWSAIAARQRTKSYQQLAVTLINMTIAILFFTYPGQILNGFNTLSKEASASVLTGVAPMYETRVNTINDAVVVSGNVLWTNLVKNPWYLMQFGKVSEGKAKESKFLGVSPSQRAANTKMEAKTNWLMTPAGLFTIRQLFLASTLLMNLVMIPVIVILALLVLISQFVPLVLLTISAAIMIVSLIPGFGFRVVQRWLERLAGAAFYKVVLSIFLSVLLIVTQIFYKLFDMFYMQILIQIVAVVAVIMEKDRIIGMFTGISKGADHVAEVATQKSNYAGKLAQAAIFAANLKTGGAISGMSVAGGFGGQAMGSGAMMGMALRAGKKYAEVRGKQKVTPFVDNYLNFKYQNEKMEAESLSQQTGKPVQYSDFVHQVNANMERGLPLYTLEQREKAVNDLYSIRKQGGNLDRIYNPVGVQTNDPKEYKQQASKYQERVRNRREKFEEARKNRMKVIGQSERMSPHVKRETMPKVSDETKEIQQSFKDHVEDQQNKVENKFEEPKPFMEQAWDERKREQTAELAKPGQPKEPKKGLTPMQQSFVQSTRRLQKDLKNGHSASTMSSSPASAKQQEYAKEAFSTTPRMPEAKAGNDGSAQMKFDFSPEEKTYMKEVDAVLADARKQKAEESAVPLSSIRPKVSASSYTSEPKKLSPDELLTQIRNESVGHNKARYVHSLHGERRALMTDMMHLDVYRKHVEGKESINPHFNSVKHKVEGLMQTTGLSAGQLSEKASQSLEIVAMKADLAAKEFGYEPRRFVRNPDFGNNSEARLLPVRGLDDTQKAIMKSAIDNLDTHKQPDAALRQSVINDWTERQKMGQSPEQYVNALSAAARQFYTEKENAFKKSGLVSVDQKQLFEEQAARAKALYEDVSARREIAKDLFGMKTSAPKSFKRKEDTE